MSDLILAVTPNPAIDKTAVIHGYRLGAIHRPERLITLAGGKGLNAARTIKRLGGEVHVSVILAGHAGHWIAEQLDREGISAGIAWANGETRACLSVYDPDSGLLTEVYENGGLIDQDSWDRFEAIVDEKLSAAQLATFSGSLPPGAPPDGYARLLRLAQARSVPALIDSRGESLRAARSSKPPLIKINASEAGELIGQSVNSINEAIGAANELRESGIAEVVITLGKLGAVAVNRDGAWHARPPAINALSPVGSGDAFLGGLAVALLRGEPLPDALRAGVAAGAANTLTLGAGLIEASTVQQFLKRVTVTRVE